MTGILVVTADNADSIWLHSSQLPSWALFTGDRFMTHVSAPRLEYRRGYQGEIDPGGRRAAKTPQSAGTIRRTMHARSLAALAQPRGGKAGGCFFQRRGLMAQLQVHSICDGWLGSSRRQHSPGTGNQPHPALRLPQEFQTNSMAGMISGKHNHRGDTPSIPAIPGHLGQVPWPLGSHSGLRVHWA